MAKMFTAILHERKNTFFSVMHDLVVPRALNTLLILRSRQPQQKYYYWFENDTQPTAAILLSKVLIICLIYNDNY